jgi:hypothetical protein
MWQNPDNLSHLTGRLSPAEVQEFHDMAVKAPAKFRQMLMSTGEDLPLIVRLRNPLGRLRDATFSLQAPRPGDVLASGDTGAVGKTMRVLTGGPFGHTSAGGEGVWHDLTMAKPKKPAIVRQLPGFALAGDGARVQLRPKQAPATPKNFSGLAQAAIAERPGFDYAQAGKLSLREIAPELNLPGGHLLSKPMELATRTQWGKKLMGWMPKPLRNSMANFRLPTCGPGETCSTLTGRLANLAGVPIPGNYRNLSPNSFARLAGPKGPYSVAGLALPEAARTATALRRQHLLKYGPLAVRAPAILGLGALGIGGLYAAGKKIKQRLGEPAG